MDLSENLNCIAGQWGSSFQASTCILQHIKQGHKGVRLIHRQGKKSFIYMLNNNTVNKIILYQII
jgi:hypothetical protein